MSTLAEEIAAAQAKVAALKVQQAEQEKRERRELADTLLVLVEERADGPEHHTTATELLTEARRRVRREAEAVRARRREAARKAAATRKQARAAAENHAQEVTNDH